MPQDYPDHHDADLVLRLYDLRREPVMREARAAINAKLWPKSFEELAQVFKDDHPLHTPFQQVRGYWEMTYSMARYGVINPEFLLESADEGLFFYAKIQPFLADIRTLRGPRALVNCEWITTQSELGQELFARVQERVAKVLASR